jgi:putative lipoprotein (rSAM/lipoprotein system)
MFNAENDSEMKMKGVFKSLTAAVLGILGFASCEKALDSHENGGMICMYGQPYADFKAVGTVKDKSGKPLEGIRVAVRLTIPNYSERNDTVYTDNKGEYVLDAQPFSSPSSVRIVFEDIDGTANGGEFEKAEATPGIKQTRKGDDSWYKGAFEAKADVKMNKK